MDVMHDFLHLRQPPRLLSPTSPCSLRTEYRTGARDAAAVVVLICSARRAVVDNKVGFGERVLPALHYWPALRAKLTAY
jgi:hypothetical protein